MDILNFNYVNFLIDFALCLVAGYLIGIERESRGKDAGISTHIMVITGSMVFTFISAAIDPEKVRIASNLLTGIGFLGAGMILKEGDKVKNLTTAASIWFSGSIGMAFGFDYYLIGIISTIAAIFVPRIPKIGN